MRRLFNWIKRLFVKDDEKMENKKRFAVIVGHDSKAKGASSAPPLRLYEYDYNKEVAALVYRIAMERGLETRIFTRDGVGTKGAYKNVEKWLKGFDGVAIELHFNSYNGKVKGTETLFDDEPSESIELAREVQEAMCLAFNRKGKENRGLKRITPGERGYPNLKACKHPSCLVEPAFGDNPDESQMLMLKQQEYATALVAAVFNYFESRDKRMALN